MPVRLYHTWLEQLQQLQQGVRITVLRNFAWLMTGLFASRSVYLSEIADELPWQCTLLSAVRRLSRLLANGSVQVRKWYEPIARQLLVAQAKALGEVRLIVDGTVVGFSHQLLMVSIAYGRRALPIAWTWVPHKRGHSSVYKQAALLAYVHKLIPPGTSVLVVGDTEFGHIPLLKLLEEWGWWYVLRQKSSNLVWRHDRNVWLSLNDLTKGPGQSEWLEQVLLTEQHQFPVNILIHWKPGEKLPWLLATNLHTRRQTLSAYSRRAWIEQMFRDFKTRGFDLEATHLGHVQRLSRLTLALVLLYVWFIATGSRAIKQGQRRLVDRNDRRDLSLFRIGRSIIKRWLRSKQSLSLHLLPNFL